jgi:hypothetical protein
MASTLESWFGLVKRHASISPVFLFVIMLLFKRYGSSLRSVLRTRSVSRQFHSTLEIAADIQRRYKTNITLHRKYGKAPASVGLNTFRSTCSHRSERVRMEVSLDDPEAVKQGTYTSRGSYLGTLVLCEWWNPP